jgi:GNAT superfamily N-acetyltransferase
LSEFTIRKSISDDFQDIKRLVKELYDAQDYTAGLDGKLNKAKFAAVMNDPRTDILVANSLHGVIGYLTLNYHKSLLDTGETAIIEELVVAAAERGKGIGTLLVNVAIDMCRERGCSEVGVGTEWTNHEARKFYTKCGFKDIGVIYEMVLGE